MPVHGTRIAIPQGNGFQFPKETAMPATILSVFRHREARALVERALADDHAVIATETGAAALAALREHDCDVVVTNDTLDDMTGEELATRVRALRPSTRVIITSTPENIDNAIRVLGAGEFIYVTKPLSAGRVRHAVGVEIENAILFAENWKLRARLDGIDPVGLLVGSSAAIENLRERIRFVATSSAPVLISGDKGTGKAVAAEVIRRMGDRVGQSLQRVDCSTTPSDLIEQELFGLERTDASGRLRKERGKVELARGGTLLIAEICDMSAANQEKLLAELAEFGDEVRVIATTSVDLKQRLRSSAFREDLYYTINTLSVEMPTLHERRADIPALAAHFVKYGAARNGVAPAALSPAALERLGSAAWRGNVRELQEVVERAGLKCAGEVVAADDLRMSPWGGAQADVDEVRRVFRHGSVRAMEKLMIINRLRENDDNRTRSAETLEISVRTLRNKLNEYNMGRRRAATVKEMVTV